MDAAETEAGIHTIGWLAGGLDAVRVARAAAERSVEVMPLSRFTLKTRRREGLLLGFAAVDANALRRGVERLAAAVDSCGRRSSKSATKRLS